MFTIKKGVKGTRIIEYMQNIIVHHENLPSKFDAAQFRYLWESVLDLEHLRQNSVPHKHLMVIQPKGFMTKLLHVGHFAAEQFLNISSLPGSRGCLNLVSHILHFKLVSEPSP
jgi:hypothetical protein